MSKRPNRSTIELPAPMWEWLRGESGESGLNVSEIIRRAIDDYRERRPPRESSMVNVQITYVCPDRRGAINAESGSYSSLHRMTEEEFEDYARHPIDNDVCMTAAAKHPKAPRYTRQVHAKMDRWGIQRIADTAPTR